MANTKQSSSRAPRTAAPRKTTMPKTPATPLARVAYVSDYAVGDHISHAMFGDGTVMAIDENKLTIEFLDDIKQIIDSYVAHRSA
jgi:hypothetical protein